MQAALSRAFLTIVTLALSLQTATAATPLTIGFEDATGVGEFLGVNAGANHGYQNFYWAWLGAGVVNPGGNVNDGVRLGVRSNDFNWVGGNGSQFVYFGSSTPETTAYVHTASAAFDFYGAFFSSPVIGALSIQGQIKSDPGNGNGGYTAVGGPIAINFDGIAPHRNIISVDPLILGIDRLVIATTSGRNFQWAMDDFVYAPIPEPGTWAMLGLGLVGVGFAVTRQQKLLRVARR